MNQYNFPTTILHGEGALAAFGERMRGKTRRALLVTDATLVKAGLAAEVIAVLERVGIEVVVYDGTRPNPVEEDVENGVEAYRRQGCDALVALGGGSPMDAAKVIRFMSTHPGPLAQYD
ncbi:MAG TPA: iron-containing alcohol dehydrogenase, partial [Fibrobacteria bacterium]|nr:iron-containing alcohol dehydrogenase [Fibrobacteria bacterium]